MELQNLQHKKKAISNKTIIINHLIMHSNFVSKAQHDTQKCMPNQRQSKQKWIFALIFMSWSHHFWSYDVWKYSWIIS